MGIRGLLSGHRNEIGRFIVQIFRAPHNVVNYGFLITTPTKERILFLTDTTGVNLKFKDIDCIMVECNHDDDTLLDNLANHDVSMAHPEFHLGLEDCAKFCKANISVNTKQIILIHLSSMNVNPDYAVKTIQEYTGFKNVSVAHAGYTYKIENDDF
jgi:phosphoribosyl 1,2-cyclic phosphodiesterase